MLASDSDEIDVLSVEMDISKRSVSCFTQQSTEYDKLLGPMTHATARLSLNWSGSKHETADGSLDDRYLWSHKCTAPVSLPFLPDLYTEVSRLVETSILCSSGPFGFELLECRGAGRAGLWEDASCGKEFSELPFLWDIFITEGSHFAL